MTRPRLVALLVGVALVLLSSWIASNTVWTEISIPMPPKGEALTNPFYAAQRFASVLGARTAWDRTLSLPPANSVIVLASWNWSLSRGRRVALERWVESGGRLVVDESLTGGEAEFERWSGISREYPEPDGKERPVCSRFQEERDGVHATGSEAYWICDVAPLSRLTSVKKPRWALRDARGIQAMRMQVGRGRVTMINASPFRHRSLFDGDHGWLLVAVTELRRGDDVHFLSEDDYPSLLGLVWQFGAPSVVLALTLVALVLWRGGVRFGPLAPPLPAGRRSLAEQIRGTGAFALRHGSGQSLHAACVRALDEAAERRIKQYGQLPAGERATVLARLTGFDRRALGAAIHQRSAPSSPELQRAIALVEAARRHILIDPKRPPHGTQ